MKKIIIVFLVGIIAIFVFYKYIGKEMYYKNQDFKKISGKIESCKIGDAIINKYTDKDNKIILSGANGLHIPCITENGIPTEMCEAIISTLTNCVTVFNNVGTKKVYDLRVSTNISSIIESISKNDTYLKEYNLKKDTEISKNTQIRKYKSLDYELILKNEKDIIFGYYTLKDIKNNKESRGEWIGSEENINKLLIDETENTFLIKGSEIIYTKDKISSTLKSVK